MTRTLLSCAMLLGLGIACRPGTQAHDTGRAGTALEPAGAPTASPSPRASVSPSTSPSQPLAMPPATAPAAGLVAFESASHGIRLSYPAGWSAVTSDDQEFILVLVRGSSRDPRSGPTLSVDVPKLPPHIPGLIPLGMVAKGYVEDLKELHPGVRVTPPAAEQLAGASARRVRAAWDERGTPRVEEAVLAVRGDRVFIFRAVADAAEHEPARAALMTMLESIEWK